MKNLIRICAIGALLGVLILPVFEFWIPYLILNFDAGLYDTYYIASPLGEASTLSLLIIIHFLAAIWMTTQTSRFSFAKISAWAWTIGSSLILIAFIASMFEAAFGPSSQMEYVEANPLVTPAHTDIGLLLVWVGIAAVGLICLLIGWTALVFSGIHDSKHDETESTF